MPVTVSPCLAWFLNVSRRWEQAEGQCSNFKHWVGTQTGAPTPTTAGAEWMRKQNRKWKTRDGSVGQKVRRNWAGQTGYMESKQVTSWQRLNRGRNLNVEQLTWQIEIFVSLFLWQQQRFAFYSCSWINVVFIATLLYMVSNCMNLQIDYKHHCVVSERELNPSANQAIINLPVGVISPPDFIGPLNKNEQYYWWQNGESAQHVG